MGRAPCCDKANVKKGPWSPEEDAKLKDYIENSGTGGNWIALPQKIGLRRCGKSCRLRWLNYLRPNIKHGGFSEEEDNIICNLYVTIGSRWSIIAAQLPGRTDNDIKNYWNTRLKKKLINKQRKEFQEARMKQEMVMMKRQQQQGQVQVQSNGNTDLYLNNMFGSSPWPLLPQLPPPPHHQVPLVMMEPTSCSYYQTTPSCDLEQKPLITLKNMVKIEEEPERTNPDHQHHHQDSITNPFDFSFSQLLLDPNYYLGSGGGGGGDFAIMSSSTNSPLPNTSGDQHQHEILQWFGSSNLQTEAINEMFINNNNIVSLETNEDTKFYGNSSVAGAGVALAGGTTSTSADQSTISWEDITSLVNSDDGSYFNAPN
ncbi:hypothetical protein AALP_AA8G517200 [Arabis alpina]|uniref:Uncharacterized protein n=1 Tax=Arabis alpina TaxID=50452 RepID=A0A087GF08_ARAAL|nr:hypothetical protein AALP_AA8G517200 [Arabis alpina]